MAKDFDHKIEQDSLYQDINAALSLNEYKTTFSLDKHLKKKVEREEMDLHRDIETRLDLIRAWKKKQRRNNVIPNSNRKAGCLKRNFYRRFIGPILLGIVVTILKDLLG